MDGITQEIASTNSVGILCEDVADVATLEQMITFIQYVNHGQVVAKFLSVDNLLEKSDSANAETMLSVLEGVFKRVDIEM